jgi:hypothetical protein
MESCDMTYVGHVKNGLITLDGAVVLPEGSTVKVVLISEGTSRNRDASAHAGATPDCDHAEPADGSGLRKRPGYVEDLPPGMAQNHGNNADQQVLDPQDESPDHADDDLTAILLLHAGKGQNLPSDLAANHDHYAHGKPKP